MTREEEVRFLRKENYSEECIPHARVGDDGVVIIDKQALIVDLITNRQHKTTPRRYSIMCMLYGVDCEKISIEEAAQKLGVTVERVRQIKLMASRDMFGHWRSERRRKLTAAYFASNHADEDKSKNPEKQE